MNQNDIRGLCPPQFNAVREAFTANFTAGEELGARFCVSQQGRIVVDLIGGFADRHHEKPFAEDTLTPVFSTTKAVASLMMARAVDQGKLDYAQKVTDLWPEFGQAGKGDLTIEQVLSHQAGLAGIPGEIDPALWFDWDAICALLAAQAPLWPPGTQSGYHPVTFGYLAGELFRRADGRTMGRALSEDIAGPHNLDIWIGLPDSEHARVAEMMKPRELPRFGPMNEALKAAFLTRWAAPGGKSAADWRRAEIPSANGHATADSLARLMSALARDGVLDGEPLLSPGMAARAARERIVGQDLVLPFVISWGAGFMRSQPTGIYGPGAESFGHSGRGGSCAFADPQRELSCAYVMNKESAALIGDARAKRLIAAVYASL